MFNVFLVDDEPFIIEGLQNIVEWNDLGLTIVGQAENGEEAWHYLKDQPVDLVVTDIMMPKMTGLELIEKVKHTHPGTRFIILSGYNEFSYVKQGIKLGVENYLLKPINLAEFRSTLETTVQKIEQTRMIRQTEEHHRDILSQNVLYRWIKDQIHLEELQQRAELLGVRFDHPYYWTVLVRPEGEFTAEDQHLYADRLKTEARAFMERYAHGFVIRGWDGEVAFVFGLMNAQEEKAALLDKLHVWKLQVEQAIGEVTIQVTSGSVAEGYLHVSSSYAHAKQVQPYHLVHSGDEIVDYEETIRYRSSRPQSLMPEIDPYVKLLYAKDREGMQWKLNEDFRHLAEEAGAEPRDMQNFAVELLLAWKQSVRDSAILQQNGDADWLGAVYHLQSMESLKEYISRTADQLVEMLNQPQDISPVVKQVLQHIDDRYAEELSLKTLSHMYNINPVYLGQLFQKEVHCTFSDYLNKTRIKQAKRMLTETHYRMSEIAEQVGYWDKSYFYKQFKKHVGVSPKEYREMQGRYQTQKVAP
jgi:two-component system, response regulator YesN